MQQPCPDSQNFNYKINMICINENEETLDIAVFCLNIILFLVLIKIAFKS